MINSFEPIVDKNSRILILGTMPGRQSLQKHENYGNDRNAFWRIIFTLFGNEVSNEYEYKKAFLLQNRIALWDVLKSCDREGSCDTDIKNPIPNDFAALFEQYNNIKTVFFNGTPAENFYKRLVARTVDKFGMKYHRLPSTSPTYVARFEDKLEKWKIILQGLME